MRARLTREPGPQNPPLLAADQIDDELQSLAGSRQVHLADHAAVDADRDGVAGLERPLVRQAAGREQLAQVPELVAVRATARAPDLIFCLRDASLPVPRCEDSTSHDYLTLRVVLSTLFGQ